MLADGSPAGWREDRTRFRSMSRSKELPGATERCLVALRKDRDKRAVSWRTSNGVGPPRCARRRVGLMTKPIADGRRSSASLTVAATRELHLGFPSPTPKTRRLHDPHLVADRKRRGANRRVKSVPANAAVVDAKATHSLFPGIGTRRRVSSDHRNGDGFCTPSRQLQPPLPAQSPTAPQCSLVILRDRNDVAMIACGILPALAQRLPGGKGISRRTALQDLQLGASHMEVICSIILRSCPAYGRVALVIGRRRWSISSPPRWWWAMLVSATASGCNQNC